MGRWARVTPLLEAPELGERAGRPVLLKLESLQVTGSFKVRGALARLSALEPGEARRGVVTCSSGNHGRAVAWAAGRLGVPARVHVPVWVDPGKLAGIRAAGAEAVVAGETFDEAEAAAQEAARTGGRVYVSAYDDPWVIAGQGTLALEIADILPGPPAAVVTPLSGGGLAAGLAQALDARYGAGVVPVHAVSAAQAAVMLASLEAGRPVEVEERETLADALAGGIGLDNRWSFRLVRDRVAAHASVEEDEIRRAMRFCYRAGLVVEGGAAVGVAAVLAGRLARVREGPGPLVVVVSGGNITPSRLAEVVSGDRGATAAG